MISQKDDFNEKQGLLLESATEEFFEKGFHGARMQEIANRAGVNKALVHYYFRSKENLYKDVIRFQFRRNIAHLLEQLHTQDSFSTALKHFINGYIDLLAENPQIPSFMLRELADGGIIVGGILKELMGQEELQAVKAVKKLMNRAVRDGEIARQDLPQLIMTVVGACIYSFVASPIIEVFMTPGSTTSASFLKARKRAVFNTIYNGIQTRRSR
jgi:TetR/AcrR family transcriptional regulator